MRLSIWFVLAAGITLSCMKKSPKVQEGTFLEKQPEETLPELQPVFQTTPLSPTHVPQETQTTLNSHSVPWFQKAFALQTILDAHAPLAWSTFLATHNSYNSRAYSDVGRYLDPNQELSVLEQLRSGIRALEFDVHSTFSTTGWPWEWGTRYLLCHGQDGHLGCSSFDRHLQEGLGEIRQWLNETAHAPEVLLLYVEDKIDTSAQRAEVKQIILNSFGNELVLPSAGSCQGIPMGLTKNEILKQGKRLLLITDGCRDENFQSLMFGGVGNSLSGFPTDKQKTFQNFPKCESQKFTKADFDTLLIRFFEDKTMLSGLVGSSDLPITADVARGLLRCGANVLGFDFLKKDDARLLASIWSWEFGEPSLGTGSCAFHGNGGTFKDGTCESMRRFACRKQDGTWAVSDVSGHWSSGFQVCSSQSARFDVPVSSSDSFRLSIKKEASSSVEVWVNFTSSGDSGLWRVEKEANFP